uniref:Uncharacterized protein n=1 Tax=Cacopsylla melanoneura TaxID=428564 RepID=A0A8D8X5G0_9HEMI
MLHFVCFIMSEEVYAVWSRHFVMGSMYSMLIIKKNKCFLFFNTAFTLLSVLYHTIIWTRLMSLGICRLLTESMYIDLVSDRYFLGNEKCYRRDSFLPIPLPLKFD